MREQHNYKADGFSHPAYTGGKLQDKLPCKRGWLPLAAQSSAAMPVAIEDVVTSVGRGVVDAATLVVQVEEACTLVYPMVVATVRDLE